MHGGALSYHRERMAIDALGHQGVIRHERLLRHLDHLMSSVSVGANI
jgi:hypothetical protein